MHEVIINKHGNDPPVTFNRNTKRKPIDAIFGSIGILVNKNGYLGFGEGIESNHRTIWTTINNEELLGSKTGIIMQTPKRRLNMDDPRSVKKYNERLLSYYKKKKIQTKINSLYNRAKREWNDKYEQEYNKIHDETITIRKQIEKSLKTIGNGKVDWSPKVQKAMRRIKYWKLMKDKNEGKNVGTKTLYRLAEILKIND